MASNNDRKPYDLEDRTFEFAKASRTFAKKLPRTIANIEDAKQFIRASGSIGANYIEANESIGKKDFLMKIRTCRREAKKAAIGSACSIAMGNSSQQEQSWWPKLKN